MITTDVPARSVSFDGLRPALLVAAAGSGMAGLVHAAAAGNHEGDPALVWMFLLAALAQLVWAVSVVVRPARPALVVGLVINGGAVAVWALTRAVGIGVIDAESVGVPDLAAALFATASVLGVVRVLRSPASRMVISPAWTSVLAVFALLAALPAMSAGHGDNHADHSSHLETAGAVTADHGEHAASTADDEGHAGGHGDDESAATEEHAQHDETASGELADHDEHSAADPTAPHADHPVDPANPAAPHPDHPADPDDPDDPHEHPDDPPDDPDDPPSGPIISVDDPRLTDAQRATALRLIAEVRSSLARFPDVAAIEAAGYVSIGDGGSDGYEHYVNWAYLVDGRELDPNFIESIVVKNNGAAPKTIVSGLYILNLGKTMADTPPLAGELTQWHDHQDLCFEGTTLVAIAVGGVCPQGVLTPTPPMLHVWIVDNPCGPFAGIGEHGVACGHEEH